MDALRDVNVLDAGDVEMYSGDAARWVILKALSGMARRRNGPAWDPAQPLLDGR